MLLLRLSAGQGQDQHSPLCSCPGWPAKAAQGLLEGVCALAIRCSHLLYPWGVHLPPSDAAGQLQLALVIGDMVTVENCPFEPNLTLQSYRSSPGLVLAVVL
jgi:hypothetical protein